MAHKYLIRLIALFLVPCLTADSLAAGVFQPNAATGIFASKSCAPNTSLFNEEALTPANSGARYLRPFSTFATLALIVGIITGPFSASGIARQTNGKYF